MLLNSYWNNHLRLYNWKKSLLQYQLARTYTCYKNHLSFHCCVAFPTTGHLLVQSWHKTLPSTHQSDTETGLPFKTIIRLTQSDWTVEVIKHITHDEQASLQSGQHLHQGRTKKSSDYKYKYKRWCIHKGIVDSKGLMSHINQQIYENTSGPAFVKSLQGPKQLPFICQSMENK